MQGKVLEVKKSLNRFWSVKEKVLQGRKVGRKIGSISDYKYSKALSEYDNDWSFEELNGYLIKPAKWIKGTKMAFAGLRKEKDRASVILYLNQNSDNPLPLP